MSSIRTKLSECPNCLEQMDAATNISGKDTVIPKKDDITICLYCGTVLVYEDDSMNMRRMNDDEIEELHPDCKRYVLTAKRLIDSMRATGKLPTKAPDKTTRHP